jgi:hypothetical protein
MDEAAPKVALCVVRVDIESKRNDDVAIAKSAYCGGEWFQG